MFVGETTDRIRRLASQGLLESNIGNDWSNRVLKAAMNGRWVRVSGWLFYDKEHALESWNVDPDDDTGRSNKRGTAWEIHPIMAIEVLDDEEVTRLGLK